MNKAEQAANKAYGGVPQLRRAFINGYEQAEKDLSMTWKDVKRIVNIADELTERKEPCHSSEQTYYEEVLRVYNEKL